MTVHLKPTTRVSKQAGVVIFPGRSNPFPSLYLKKKAESVLDVYSLPLS
ncbi:MAG: hypothetical protein ACN6RK_05005 [Stenotrophomonas sp.]